MLVPVLALVLAEERRRQQRLLQLLSSRAQLYPAQLGRCDIPHSVT